MDLNEEARSKRRFRALVAWLKSTGETNLDSLDRTNPIISNATLAELDRAIAEVVEQTKCPLTQTIEKWMRGGTTLQVACEPETWKPLKEARYENLKRWEYVNGRTIFVYNAVEVFQISYLQRVHDRRYAIAYHVQPLVGSQKPAYHRIKLNDGGDQIIECVELVGLPISRFSARREAHGAMSGDHFVTILTHPETKPINPISMPLHEIIKNFRS